MQEDWQHLPGGGGGGFPKSSCHCHGLKNLQSLCKSKVNINIPIVVLIFVLLYNCCLLSAGKLIVGVTVLYCKLL